MYQYNPYQQYMPQNRAYNTQDQYNQFNQVPQMNFLKVIPVTNIEEAKASVVDTTNSTPSFFYNKGKNEVYLKQFDINTGNAIFITFEPSKMPNLEETSSSNTNSYLDEIKAINGKIDGLISMFDKKTKKKGELDE